MKFIERSPRWRAGGGIAFWSRAVCSTLPSWPVLGYAATVRSRINQLNVRVSSGLAVARRIKIRCTVKESLAIPWRISGEKSRGKVGQVRTWQQVSREICIMIQVGSHNRPRNAKENSHSIHINLSSQSLWMTLIPILQNSY